ncbi:MAG: 3-oxoacyl-ACP reductase family protein [Candidatus Saliniplasma sp.]
MKGKLEGKRAIVTGASRGIGRGIAEKFADEGAVVGINYYKSEEEAQDVLKYVTSKSDGILLQGDVSDEKDCEDMVERYVDEFNSIDILVNNAGIYYRKDLEESEIEDYDRTIDVNVRGPFILCKLCLPHLKESGAGRIVNLSSQLAFRGSTHGTAYVTSKAALVGLTRALSLELGPEGITVNGIAPGTIDTDIIGSYSEEKRKQRAEKIPVKRIGKPIDIANATVFLASDMGSYVNGDILGVNGGSALH